MAKSTKKEEAFLSDLKSTPRQTQFETHYWADYIELRCLFNPDNVFSKDDFLDAYRSNKDFLPKEDSLDEDEGNNDDLTKDEPAYKNDKEEAFADNCFKLFDYRIKTFKEYYPFTLSSNKRALFKKKNFIWKNRCYIFLLLSSSLKYIQKNKSIFTSSFEFFSLHVLKTLLPSHAKAHFFGSSNALIKSKRYTGHIWNKLDKFRQDLNEKFMKYTKADFPETAAGDAGFDFVAWVSNGDDQSHLISFTGQAACTDNWTLKQYSSSGETLSGYMSISVQPINLLFVPFSLRSETGKWRLAKPIINCVMLDRQRLIYHFGNVHKHYTSLPCDNTIKELLKLKDTPYN